MLFKITEQSRQKLALLLWMVEAEEVIERKGRRTNEAQVKNKL